MKIVHLCLGCFYIDNYAYQENLLPKYHQAMGHNVSIVASLFTFDVHGQGMDLPEARSYINEYGIPVHRLAYRPSLRPMQRLFRRYVGLKDRLEAEQPDLLFIHGCQFMDMHTVVAYLDAHPGVAVLVDNHADFSNSATNVLSRWLLHGLIWRQCAHLIEPYTRKFFGVLPARVDFLREVYRLPPEKLELLVMGADDDLVEAVRAPGVRERTRARFGVGPQDFLVITGGKIDHAKRQTLLLMRAVARLDRINVKLVVFGSVVEDLKREVEALTDGDHVQFVGWISPAESYACFNAADLVVFPGRHSVFWEQVCGLGVPMVARYWEGTTHVDIEGNCRFLREDSEDEILGMLTELTAAGPAYQAMRVAAQGPGARVFSYRDIARRSLAATGLA